jgi:BirA family biotin operon repressor/biotin-[acetyl-CoA-carboxylase] ligase
MWGLGEVRRFDRLDSTNRYLLDEARAGAPAGVVAVADYQTAGRGRRGRRWAAPPGSNLLVSVLLRPTVAADERPAAAAAAGLAARAAIGRVTGVPLGVKWPNDLVTEDGRKVAGVLAETDAGPGGPSMPASVVVGVGINCNWPVEPPTDAADPDLVRAASLRQLSGRPVDREALLSAFLDELAPRVGSLDDPSGRAALRDELEGATSTLGARVRVELIDGALEGTATGLTAEGHLLVRTADGATATVVTGDVVHLRPAGDPSPSDAPPEGGAPLQG